MNTTTYKELQKNRKTNFDKLAAKLAGIAKGTQTFYNEKNDERFWRPTLDKSGGGYAIIRLLPEPKGENDAVVHVFSHGFEGPGGWYIEKSLMTPREGHPDGSADPVGEMNRKLWAQGEDSEGRRFVSGDNTSKPNKPGSKRKLSYYANIYVVEDPKNPTNNGKVFLWKFGKKLFDKINEASSPKYPDVQKFDPFDLEGGANLKFKIKMGPYGPDYSDTEWDLVEKDGMKVPRGPVAKNDKEIEKIWELAHSLAAIIAPDKFKSYNQLKERLALVMAKDNNSSEDEVQENTKEAPVTDTRPPPWEEEVTTENDSGDDLEYFRTLRDKN